MTTIEHVTPPGPPRPMSENPAGPPRPRPTRSPARRRIQLSAPPKAFDHTGYADEATLALGALVHLTDTPAWAVIIAGSLAVIGIWAWSWDRFHHRGVTIFAVGVTACSTAWITWAAIDTPWSLPSLLALIAGTFALGPVYARLRWHTDRRHEKEHAARAEANQLVKQHQFIGILARAGAPDITIDDKMDGDIDGATWRKGGREFPAGFSLALALGEKAPDARSLVSLLPGIEKVASGSTRYPIRPGSIQIRPNPSRAHLCEMVIPTKDILAETIPVPDRVGPRSINDLIEVATSVDGTVLGWDVHKDVHGMVAGMTNVGKTVFMDAHILETTRSTDCVTWLICGAKPVRALLPWLLPFLEGHIAPNGQPCNPVIDWFAPDLYEAGMMLIDAYIACERRQQSAAINKNERWEPTPDAPAVVLFIDESPKFLQSNFQFVNHKGEKKTFSELLLDLETVSRSEDIHLFYLTQRGTVSMNGSNAGDIKSQTSYRAGFYATGIIDANAVFKTSTHAVQVESLPVGGLYLEMQGDSQPVLAKAMYADTDRKLAAAAAHSIYCSPLDTWTTDPDPTVGYEGMLYYSGRWLRKNQQDFLRQLCPTPVQVVPAGTLPPELTGGAREVEVMRAFGEWMDSTYPDESATPELLSQFLRTYTPPTGTVEPAEVDNPIKPVNEGIDAYRTWLEQVYPGEESSAQRLIEFSAINWSSTDSREQERARAGATEDEIRELDNLFEAPAYEPPPAWRINSDLREDTRKLLEVLAVSDLLYTTEEYIPARDLLALAVEKLGWPESSTAGGRKIAEALRHVSVVKAEPRPTIDNKKTIAYRTADLRQAVDRNRVDGDPS